MQKRKHTGLKASVFVVTSLDGFAPLGLAIFFAHQETALALLDAGADLNIASKESIRVRLPHSAVTAHQIAIAKGLIAPGANVFARSENTIAPLHEAAAKGALDFAILLIDAGADVNSKTKDGKTLLGYAAANKRDEMQATKQEQRVRP